IKLQEANLQSTDSAVGDPPPVSSVAPRHGLAGFRLLMPPAVRQALSPDATFNQLPNGMQTAAHVGGQGGQAGRATGVHDLFAASNLVKHFFRRPFVEAGATLEKGDDE